jgi:hypothetical protein
VLKKTNAIAEVPKDAFVKAVETYRRHRETRLKLGDESVKLSSISDVVPGAKGKGMGKGGKSGGALYASMPSGALSGAAPVAVKRPMDSDFAAKRPVPKGMGKMGGK